MYPYFCLPLMEVWKRYNLLPIRDTWIKALQSGAFRQYKKCVFFSFIACGTVVTIPAGRQAT
jgi:hypothetical protein